MPFTDQSEIDRFVERHNELAYRFGQEDRHRVMPVKPRWLIKAPL
jgi:hypothetical protein